MQVMFNTDGTIRKVYDEVFHHHPENVTVSISQEQADNISLYRVNPNIKELYLLPTCEQKYIKTVKNVVLEMSAEEKAVVDNNIITQTALAEALVIKNDAKAQAIAGNLPNWTTVQTAIEGATTIAALRAIILKLARVVYWDVKDKAD